MPSASRHRVVTFDNVGVGATTGTTPATMAQMGRDAIEFMTVMGFDQVDLLGFSIGSFVAQEVALTRPSLVRRLILASSAPKGAAGMHGWAAQVIDAVGGHQPNPEGVLAVFYTGSTTSRTAGQQSLKRISARTDGPRRAHHVADPPCTVRRSVRVGYPKPRALGEARGDQDASVHRQRG